METPRKSDAKNDVIPKDYEELYLHYIAGTMTRPSLCQQIIRTMTKGNATEEEREVLSHDVFTRCLEKDILKVFDPSKANFGGVIFFVTRSIVVNYLSRKARNPLGNLRAGTLVESSGGDEESFEPGVYSLDAMFSSPTPRLRCSD